MTYPLPAITIIKKHAPHIEPKIGLILGSGLGEFAKQIKNAIKIPYAELPGFPRSTIAGHAGQLVLGQIGGCHVACMQGRVHGYEGATATDFKNFIRTLKLLGCETLLITNASGSLRSDVKPGELMLINDHINFQSFSPLAGPNDEEFGPRFFAMTQAYDPKLRARFLTIAKRLNIKLTEGVYFGVAGPHFETPAEIRAFRTLGGDAIGMSTVPEVLIARHAGMRVAVVAAITNLAAGMSDQEITHEETLHFANLAATDLTRLLIATIESLQHEPC